MSPRRMRDASNQSKLIRFRRILWHVLTDIKSGKTRLNGFKLPLSLTRRIWFPVKRIQMRNTSRQIQEQDGIRFRFLGSGLLCIGSSQL